MVSGYSESDIMVGEEFWVILYYRQCIIVHRALIYRGWSGLQQGVDLYDGVGDGGGSTEQTRLPEEK